MKEIEVKEKTIDEVYENEMKREYNLHEIPHINTIGKYEIKWFPQWFGEDDEKHVEYVLTISDDTEHRKGSFEQWKKAKGLV